MSLNYPNIVPENNLRLPDALTVEHGPARLLARFVLEADKTARALGIRLRLRNDFDTLLELNRKTIPTGSWFKLANMFNHEYGGLSPENSFWISGVDETDEIVLSQAGRLYYWPETTLADEARLMFYAGREEGQSCLVTAPTAKGITGVVYYSGGLWVHPRFRGHGLSRLMPRVGRAYASARWPVDWVFTFVSRELVRKGVAAGYGYRDVSYAVQYPGSPWGNLDFALVRMGTQEIYADLASFLAEELLSSDVGSAAASSAARPAAPGFTSDDSVINVSPRPVLHGSSSLS
jgi:GNAT superfamily N-acetyltransferase